MCLRTGFSVAQSTGFRSYKVDWSKYPYEPIAVVDSFKNQDAVVLLEENEIFIPRAYDQNFSFKRHIRVKLLNNKGVSDFSKFKLPVSFDTEYDQAYIPYTKRAKTNYPLYYDMEVLYFAIRVIKSDGKIIEIIPHNKINGIETFYDNIYYHTQLLKAFNYFFWVDENTFQVNDEIEVVYKYTVPNNIFAGWGSHRFFFHGKHSKQECSFKFNYEIDNHFFLSNKNIESKISVIPDFSNKKMGFKVFSLTNLNNISNDAGSKLYIDIPYISFYTNKGDYGQYDISNPNDRKIVKVLPYPWTYIMKHNISYLNTKDYKTIYKRKDDDTFALNNLYNQSGVDIADSTGVALMMNLHKNISDSFSYMNNFERYKKDAYNSETTSIAAALKRKLLIEEHRHYIYSFCAFKVNKPFFIAIIPDNRIERIDQFAAHPLLSCNGIYAFTKGNKIHYFFPKRQRYGYEVNEFPFYMENNRSILVTQNADMQSYEDVDKRKSGVAEQKLEEDRIVNNDLIKFSTTYNSDENANIRTTSSLININLRTKEGHIDTKLLLSGQYSTLIRGNYQYNNKDSSINPLYNTKPFDSLNLVSTMIIGHNDKFPFNTSIRLKHVQEIFFNDINDTLITINTKNWFHHVVYPNFTSINRILNFYPDFKSQDRYKYILKFDMPVRLKSNPDHLVDISNEFGKYQFSIKQTSDTEIEIESYYAVLTDMVLAEKTKFVEEIFKSIETSENMILEVVIKK